MPKPVLTHWPPPGRNLRRWSLTTGLARREDPSAKGVLCRGAGDPGHPDGGTGTGEQGNRQRHSARGGLEGRTQKVWRRRRGGPVMSEALIAIPAGIPPRHRAQRHWQRLPAGYGAGAFPCLRHVGHARNSRRSSTAADISPPRSKAARIAQKVSASPAAPLACRPEGEGRGLDPQVARPPGRESPVRRPFMPPAAGPRLADPAASWRSRTARAFASPTTTVVAAVRRASRAARHAPRLGR
jgi:hypothetical protein